MSEETFFRIQHSEGMVCTMAAQILAAFITTNQLTQANEDQLIARAANLAIKLAHKVDKTIDSDDENVER